MDLPQKVDLLVPDLTDFVAEICCFCFGQDGSGGIMSTYPIGLVCHFNCFIMVHLLVNLWVTQMLQPFPHIILCVHHNQASALVSLPDGESFVPFQLIGCPPHILRDVGEEVQSCLVLQTFFHLLQYLLDREGEHTSSMATESPVCPRAPFPVSLEELQGGRY